MKQSKQTWLWLVVCVMLCWAAMSVCCGQAVGNAGGDGAAESSDFHKFFVAGGLLVWVILLPLSLVTISLVVQLFLTIRREKLLPGGLAQRTVELIKEKNFAAAEQKLSNNPSLLAQVLIGGLAHRDKGTRHAETVMADVLEQNCMGLMRKVEWLHIIGNVAPMIGLFGTVWGMIDAFDGIVRAGGQPEPAELAGGISVALVTTWWGLIVAIPSLAAFGALRNRIDAAAAEVALAAESLTEQLEDSAKTAKAPE
ncbi:MAG: MotA/TolQ/ExbB proton channel family protein [Sedimentisphaerales bacterium]|nr:MotA/TolQ/ExbB proton channel family protein [Sedimentisphaerales bacterium]